MNVDLLKRAFDSIDAMGIHRISGKKFKLGNAIIGVTNQAFPGTDKGAKGMIANSATFSSFYIDYCDWLGCTGNNKREILWVLWQQLHDSDFAVNLALFVSHTHTHIHSHSQMQANTEDLGECHHR